MQAVQEAEVEVEAPRPSQEHASVSSSSGKFQISAADLLELAERAAALGENRLPESTSTTFAALVWEALQDFTVMILLAAGGVSIGLGLIFEREKNGWIEGAAILAAVAVVVLVTAVNNYQKEQQFKQLSAISDDVKVTVLRGGVTKDISKYELVVGDVMLVNTGDVMLADGLLFQVNDMSVDESHLTGESNAVIKTLEAAPMLYAGAKVLEGYGRAIVTAVGLNSQQGIIAGLVMGAGLPPAGQQDAGLKEMTTLERKLEKMAAQIGNFGLLAALFSLGAMAGQFSWQRFVVQGQAWDWAFLADYLHFLITAITIVVVAVPEGLPLAVTIALAYSVKRMLSDNNLVRHLGAAETMGCATTICTDKTGTLTQNDMSVVRLWIGGQEFRDVQETCNTARRSRPAWFKPEEAREGADGPQESESAPPPEGRIREDCLGLDPRVHSLLCDSIALNSTANIKAQAGTAELVKVGNRTECAMLALVHDLGGDIEQIRGQNKLLRVFPFSSDRKRMTSITYQDGCSLDGAQCCRVFSKGAAELMLDICAMRIASDSSVTHFTQEEKDELLDSFGQDGSRMLALAYKDMFIPYQSEDNGDLFNPVQVESGLTLVAMVGIEDPVRTEVPAAIRQCQRAGITVRMLTGDNATTAASIARQCGILPVDYVTPAPSTSRARQPESVWEADAFGELDRASNASGSRPEDASQTGPDGSSDRTDSHDSSTSSGRHVGMVLDGKEFRQRVNQPGGAINRAEFDAIWANLRVLARCSPTDKYTIVRALRDDPSEIVAMTGDGTNDAPALRNADVGFAMNSGTSIAKEASDILLLDDNFNSIVSAVKWGRNVYAGITKFLQFQLVVNVVAVGTACVGAFALQESPLTAVQMLWVNLIMDSLASLALATEAPTDDMLDLPPYSAQQSLITPTVLKNIVGQSIFQLGVMYALVFHGDAIFGVPSAASVGGPSQHYTIVFNTFVLMQLFNQINTRKINDEADVLAGALQNKLFCGILAAELVLQVAIVQFGDVTNVSQERSTHHRGSWAQGRTQQMKRGTPEDRTFVGDCSLSARQREVSVLEKLREWRLGEGGCAVVHRCRKADDHTYRFAAKVITYGPSNCRDNLEAIFDEINIMRERASGLPHVIELQDFAFDDETMEAYLIFRLLQGCTLEELKEQRWFHSMPIPRREGVVREMARQLFQALSDLHRRGAYHCDVKGANVFLSLAAPPARPGTLDLQLIDFGLAERCEAGQHVRMIGGTPAYMPPEIAKARIRALLGKRVVLVNPAAADVYSAAITLFEACFGCVPFWVTESQEMSQLKELRLLQKWALCEPKPWSCKRLPMHDMHLQLRELSPAAQDFFAQAMCADPAARLTMSQALEHDFLQADSNCLVPEAFLAGFGTLQ
ncbi:hypothetical protein WJX72_000653 [[Myrmecia] bisecta]|uniref:P-type Cu(+) transporter n=1 Tax=[Myrmecia] bisecta TaxID=41462 RepID=A0AAW1R489_9CHLO